LIPPGGEGLTERGAGRTAEEAGSPRKDPEKENAAKEELCRLLTAGGGGGGFGGFFGGFCIFGGLFSQLATQKKGGKR